jgi:hypothetical protein
MNRKPHGILQEMPMKPFPCTIRLNAANAIGNSTRQCRVQVAPWSVCYSHGVILINLVGTRALYCSCLGEPLLELGEKLRADFIRAVAVDGPQDAKLVVVLQ